MHSLQTFATNAASKGKRGVGLPFVGGGVEDGDAADGEFGYALWEGVLGADGAEEGVPAVGDGGVVQERQVEGD